VRARLLVLAIAACSPDRGPKWRPAGNSTPRDGGTVRIAVKDQLSKLDPTIANDETTLYALHPMVDTLVDFDRDLHIVPRLAESYEVSDDTTTFTFHLRTGLHYADGQPIVAGHFKYALERSLATPASPYRQFIGDIAGAGDVTADRPDCAGITAPSDRDLVIRLAKPNAAFIDILTMVFAAPQRRDWVAQQGDDLRRHPLASGPYMLESWSEGEEIALVRNPNYFDPHRSHLERIVIRENIARDTQFLMFERGELDAAERLSAPDYLWVTSQDDWKPYIHTRALMNVYGSRMDVRDPRFKDRRVRQALNYALNKDHTEILLTRTSVKSHGLLPPGMFGRDDAIRPYAHDPAKARQLLAAAGFPDGFDVEYVTQSGDDETQKLAESLQADLAEVGVRVRISFMTFDTLNDAAGNKDRDPPFSIGSWLGDYPDPSDFFDTQFASSSIAAENSPNNTFYVNPELDKLLDAARGERDAARREAMYRRAERIVYDDAPWIWDYHRLMTEVTQPYVQGYEPHPVWIRDYTSAWLDVGPDGEPVKR
jgi:peptide/nickel transport system substrate-binding protein/oligopeptide transport system substrate-binding protein